MGRMLFWMRLVAYPTTLYYTLYTVESGHRAILFDRFCGIHDEQIYNEGTHARIPWIEKPYIFDIRSRPHTFSTISTGTKDLQMVNFTLRVLSRPDTRYLPTIVRNLGLEYAEKVLPSLVNEVLKDVVAKFNAEHLLTHRHQVSALVRDTLVRRAKDFNILLDDVFITDFSYDAEFSRAVELKQVAQQEAERSKFVLMKAELERRAAIIRAEGETDATKPGGKVDAPSLFSYPTLANSPNVFDLPGVKNLLMTLNALD